jgi:hypothetical protein
MVFFSIASLPQRNSFFHHIPPLDLRLLRTVACPVSRSVSLLSPDLPCFLCGCGFAGEPGLELWTFFFFLHHFFFSCPVFSFVIPDVLLSAM